MTIEHQPWPKISRLFRDVIITEKIDGANAAVGIRRLLPEEYDTVIPGALTIERVNGDRYVTWTQSRKKIIDLIADNAGFAAYVCSQGEALVRTLGEGLHFGEWWGSGINRGYGLSKGEKRFSLFNTPRYGDPEKFDLTQVPGLDIVPVLHEGAFSTELIKSVCDGLRRNGSHAAPGYDNPEGIITFHTASRVAYKITLDNDDKPKGSTE
jgi:hypothetical protein